MKRRAKVICFAAVLLWCQAGIAHANKWAETIDRLKPTVVNLEVTTQVNVGLDKPGIWQGTGFIVDAKRGIIATNRHLTSTSPAHIRITFIDGSSTGGKILYYDYYHDFSFVRFDPSSVALELKEATLGSSFDLKPQ
jgi:S1-C subfamily serine protease